MKPSLLFYCFSTMSLVVHGFRGASIPSCRIAKVSPTSAFGTCYGTPFNGPPSFSSSKARMTSTRQFVNRRDGDDAIERLLADMDLVEGDEAPEIVMVNPDGEDIDGAIFEDLETGRPAQLMVMKELLGINGFTYLLGALILFLMGLNFFLGPGWMGQLLGMQGVGSIDEVSKSLPDNVDLTNPEFRLDL